MNETHEYDKDSSLSSLDDDYLPSQLHDDPSVKSLPPLGLLDSTHINGLDYTILTRKEMTFLTFILGVVGLCSSFSMPIYWPVLPELRKVFNTTEEKINYTITAYLVFQAVSPVFVSSLSDVFGRRPVIISCMVGGIAINVGLACTRAYWLLIFLRCLLAASVAPLVSITAAAVGDMSTKQNRGSLTAFAAGLTLAGQALAPFLGAVMDTAWDWPAIFWFSAAMQGFILAMFFILAPETNRRFVGNLGVRPKGWIHWSPALWYLKDRLSVKNEPTLELGKITYNPWRPLSLIRKPSVFLILLPAAIQFGSWTIAQTSMSVHLQNDYNYSVLDVGLCFFAPGAGTFLGTNITGKILDLLYRRRKQSYIEKYKEELEHGGQIPPFNIINCRLLPFFPFALIAGISTLVFGWCLQYKVRLPAILVFQFLNTLFTMYPLNVVNTVLLDMFPGISGGVTALNNLFRCGMASIFVSCLTQMESSMKLGGLYSLMMGLIIVSALLVLVLMQKSQKILEDNLSN